MHWALQENTINKLVRYSGNVPNGNRLKLVAMGWFLIRVQLFEISDSGFYSHAPIASGDIMDAVQLSNSSRAFSF